MTDELQNEVETEQVEATETDESGADLAPATGENQENQEAKSDEDERNDKVQAAINRQHRKFREEERKRIAAEEEAAKLREQVEAQKTTADSIVIPPIPDPYDDDYETKIQTRDAAIQRKAELEAAEKVAKEQQAAQQQAAEQEENKRFNELGQNYAANAQKLGISKDEMAQAGQTVIDYGISPELSTFLLEDEDGPVISKYLASNPVEMDEIFNLPIHQAIIRLDKSVRDKASVLKPKVTSAPEPAETLGGTGGGDSASPFLRGATFE